MNIHPHIQQMLIKHPPPGAAITLLHPHSRGLNEHPGEAQHLGCAQLVLRWLPQPFLSLSLILVLSRGLWGCMPLTSRHCHTLSTAARLAGWSINGSEKNN